MKSKSSVSFSFFFIIVGVGLIVFFAFDKSFNDGSGIINTKTASEFGSFIGGLIAPIFSIAGFFLLYATLMEQKNIYQFQQFENKFLELLRYHRENVSQMSIILPSNKEHERVHGIRCFVELKKHFEEIYIIVEDKIPKEWPVNLAIQKLKIKLAASILLYGVDDVTIAILIANVQEIDVVLVNLVIEECKKKKCLHDQAICYYGNNQARLANYFKHLFHLINFVDNTKFLTQEEKNDYFRIIRAQFNQYEAAIVFFQSFTKRGNDWFTSGLLVKYKLLKNMPVNFIKGINPKDYYAIEFEYEK